MVCDGQQSKCSRGMYIVTGWVATKGRSVGGNQRQVGSAGLLVLQVCFPFASVVVYTVGVTQLEACTKLQRLALSKQITSKFLRSNILVVR